MEYGGETLDMQRLPAYPIACQFYKTALEKTSLNSKAITVLEFSEKVTIVDDNQDGNCHVPRICYTALAPKRKMS